MEKQISGIIGISLFTVPGAPLAISQGYLLWLILKTSINHEGHEEHEENQRFDLLEQLTRWVSHQSDRVLCFSS